ncbi:MAG: SWIM zinc finger family protein [Myxococcota bacterium]
MSFAQRYLGRSRVDGGMLTFSPNLARPKVFFEGELRSPVRYREAMSALHEVVIGDLSRQPRDKSAYRAYQAELQREEEELRRVAFDDEQRQALLEIADIEEPKDLKKRFKQARMSYYRARSKWIRELRHRDSKLWWLLDPVVTVAPDVVLFECFSKDESSYACLTVDRDAFSHQDESGQGLGTTNVDYSFALYEHLQTLRSYRPTQLSVDPQGFEVHVTGHPDFREDKIDLPPSWLRGFGQIQAAQMLPGDRVRLSRDAVYSLVAFLTRNREKKGPRAIRFELDPGQPARLVLEPWNRELGGTGPRYEGDKPASYRLWGRRRLLVLARLLPLVEHVDVHLLGTGLPSLWVARLGEMTFTLALSGWTANDWTSGANLALLAGRYRSNPAITAKALGLLKTEQRLTMAELKTKLEAPERAVHGSLHDLALRGQAIFDHAHGVYRYRMAMHSPIEPGPAHPELTAAEGAVANKQVKLERNELVDTRWLLAGTVGGTSCEALLDADGIIKRAQCSCSYYFRNKLRGGPCRHLLALKLTAEAPRFGDKPRLV